MTTTTSSKAKAAGFKSLSQVAEIYGVTTETLRNYDKHEPTKLQIIFLGCAAYLAQFEDHE